MKKKIFITLACFIGLFPICFAQHAKFYIYLPDNGTVAGIMWSPGNTIPVFADAQVNNIFNNYTIYKWRKVDPVADYEVLRNVYVVECNNIQLAYDLQQYDPRLFGKIQVDKGGFSLGTSVPPGDYTGAGNMNGYLSIINAIDAWRVTTGDPNVRIGITDTYFDLAHEELKDKIVHVGANTPSSSNHGTSVAGMVAANTDNGKGLSAIGYNCRMDVSNNLYNMYELNKMVDSGCKVLNASWFTDTNNDLEVGIRNNFYDVALSNSIYDKGAVAVFGAGNGRWTAEGNSTNYTFPGSLDHNISVTNSGWLNETGGINTFNNKYIHESNVGDTGVVATDPDSMKLDDKIRCYQHNDRVDICAPALMVGALNYIPGLSNQYAWNGESGTSFAAPIVAGTAGLMYSKIPWAWPYLIEYILKTTAYDIYTYRDNEKYQGPTRYTGRLGAGMLDAGLALWDIANHDPYDDLTYTFRIKGITYNTRCKPEFTSNGILPVLQVITEHGSQDPSQYRYKWEPYPDNTATLSDMDSDNPQITASDNAGGTRPDRFHYRLTVYDGSDIMKVATKDISFDFLTDPTKPDLVMRDAYADLLNEPNNMQQLNSYDWNIWESPDLWNRINPGDPQKPRNPDYSQDNLLAVRVKNVGCANSAPNTPMKLYWTVASMDEQWEHDWTTPPNGEEIPAAPIGLLRPGRDTIIYNPWTNVPRPQDYDNMDTATQLGVCILARILEVKNSAGVDWTGIQEGTDVNENVRKSNNIVTRNLIVTNFSGAKGSQKIMMMAGNIKGVNQAYTVQLVTQKQLNPSYEGYLPMYLSAKVHLGDLYPLWVSGGRLGNYTSYNDMDRTVTTDLVKPLRLENINMPPESKYKMYVELSLKDSVSIGRPVVEERIFMRQLMADSALVDNGDGTSLIHHFEKVTGNVGFAINITDGPAYKQAGTSAPGTKAEARTLIVYPNPAHTTLTVRTPDTHMAVAAITLTDISGKVLVRIARPGFEQGRYTINIAALPPGNYVLQLTTINGTAYDSKFVKITQ